MSSFALSVENLGKIYRLGLKEDIHDTIVGAMTSWLRAPLRNFRNLRKLTSFDANESSEDAFWALRDVSFSVSHGEVLGIIGHNGAGKSTLLKILSRITDPTVGAVILNGRVASLLEVGTGFHQDLTGRENIYMNGTILGMSKREIDRKFDEIVDFSGVEKFIDTPIKRYSSGMKVRLAFSVAAHLEPEILVIDEVLAVGDAAFQKKCLGKMHHVAVQGRTVLFVSHQLEALSKLCNRALLLERGMVVKEGETDDVISTYLHKQASLCEIAVIDRMDRKGDGRFRFISTWLENETGTRVSSIQSGRFLKIVATFKVTGLSKVSNLDVAFAVVDQNDVQLIDFSNRTTGNFFHGNIPDQGRIECSIPKLPLNQGRYYYHLWARSGGGLEDHVLKAGFIDVSSGDFFGSGNMPDPRWPFMAEHNWKVRDYD